MKHNFIFGINKRAHSREIIAIIITAVVIVLLLLSGPATAFDLTLGDLSDANPLQGDLVTFTATVEVVANELVPISNLSINFSNGITCYFDADGTILTPGDCDGITITPDENTVDYAAGNLDFNFSGTPYDYGYGYAATGPGILNYTISLDTGVFAPGSLDFSLNAIMNNSAVFTSDSQSINIIVDTTAPQIIFNWWDTLDWNDTTQSGEPIQLPNPKNFTTNSDIFYSPAERTIYFAVNATDNESGVASVTANLSEIGEFPSAGTCDGLLVLVENATTGLWEGDCTLDLFNSDMIGDYLTGIGQGDGQVASFSVYFITEDNEGNSDEFMYNKSTDGPAMPCTSEDEDNCMPAFAIVNLEDFGVMTMNETCVRFGSGTTNLSQELDFNDINFTIDIEVNMTCQEPGAPPGLNDFKRMVLFNFASLNFGSPAVGAKLGMLPEALQFEITPPLSWGNSRIYVNSTFFAELNTTSTIILSHLPFTTEPNIISDTGGGIVSQDWVTNGYEASFGVITGNLTFEVSGFSGYNVTDNVTPIVAIDYPDNGDIFGTTGALTINVTANGTGSEVSKVSILVDAVESTWSSELNDFNCTPASNGSENVTCSYITALSNGTHTITATAWDYGGAEPGNNASTSIGFTVDGTPPIVKISSPSAGAWTNDNTTLITFNFTDALSPTADCIVYIGGVAYGENDSVINDAATVIEIGPALADGTSYSLQVNCTDNYNNEGGSAAQTLKVDTHAPTATINTASFNTSSTTPTINFKYNDALSPNASCTLYFNGGNVGTNASVQNNTNTSITTGAMGPGTYTVNVNCTDLANNLASSTPITVKIDNGTPSVAIISPAANAWLNNATPGINFNYTDGQSPTANCSVIINGTYRGTNASVQNNTATLITVDSTLANYENYTLNVTCADDVANKGYATRTISIDTAAPTVTASSPDDETLTNDNTPTFTFLPNDTLSPTMNSCILYVGATAYGVNTSLTNAQSATLTANASIPDGNQTWNITCYDKANNTGASTARHIIIDATAPVVKLISPANGTTINTSTTPNHYYNVTDSLSDTFNCTFAWGGSNPGNQNFTGVNNASVDSSVDAGYLVSVENSNVTWNISCTDEAGTTNTSLTWRYLMNDTTAPVISDASPDGTEYSSSTTSVPLSVTTDESASCRYSTNNINYGNMTNNFTDDTTDHTATVSVSSNHDYTYYVTCIDVNDNEASATITFSVKASSSSSGGGGGGVPTPPSTSQTWDQLTPGTHTMKITNDDFGIDEITFNVNEGSDDAKILIEQLSERPSATIEIGGLGKIFRYLKITPVNINLAGPIKIKFTVPKSWLEQNGLKPEDIALNRYADGKWTSLPTTILSTEGDFISFEAESPGFSYFAIGTKAATEELTAFTIIDMIRAFFQGKSTLTQFEIIDTIREFYTKSK